MKIIIMTGKFGMGHFMAAQAIKEILENSIIKAEIEVVDWINYVSPKYSDQLYKLFRFAVNKGGKLYNQRYKWLENSRINRKPELYHYFLKQFSNFTEEKRPDIIIATLPICAQIASCYKEKMHVDLPLITCVTDITGHSEWIAPKTDYYFVGSTTVKEKLIKKGVRPQQIYETGIPVNPLFDEVGSKAVKLSGNSKKNILVMGGGLGILPNNFCFYEKLSQFAIGDITVITGSNLALQNKLTGKFGNLKVLGFVDKVYEYMKKADIIITKPGGITTFEAIYAEVPILALNPYLQQEVYNAEYINEMQIGSVVTGNIEDNLHLIEKLLTDEKQLNVYKNNMKCLKKQFAENRFDKIITNLINGLNYQSAKKSFQEYNKLGEDIILHEKINFNI